MSRLTDERYLFDVETFDDDWERMEHERAELNREFGKVHASERVFLWCLVSLGTLVFTGVLMLLEAYLCGNLGYSF